MLDRQRLDELAHRRCRCELTASGAYGYPGAYLLAIHILLDCKRWRWRYDLPREAEAGEKPDR